jgi:sugar lactone lactonase YvrE
MVGSLSLTQRKNLLLLGMQGQLALLDTLSNKIEICGKIDDSKPNNRCNDGQVDVLGRLWVGTMKMSNQKDEGSLFCVSSDMKPIVKLTGLGISNGIGWSLDNKIMYFIDSMDNCIKAFHFDSLNKNITDAKVIYTVQRENEVPDGMCVDSEGMLWVAFWDGFRVARINPVTGEELAEVIVPAPLVTSCTFIGEDLDQLTITTARVGLSDEALNIYPLSGSVFTCQVGVKGRLVNVFEY